MIVHVATPYAATITAKMVPYATRKLSVAIEASDVSGVDGSVVEMKNGARIRTGETEDNLMLLLCTARRLRAW